MWYWVAGVHFAATAAATALSLALFRLPVGGQAPGAAAVLADWIFVLLSWPLVPLAKRAFDLQVRQFADLAVLALLLASNSLVWGAVLTALWSALSPGRRAP